jgi:hypothetical protein
MGATDLPSTDVEAFVNEIARPVRRQEAQTFLTMFKRATGEPPQISGNAIVFGSYNYRYSNGREGTAPAAGFAPAKTGITVYLLDGVGAHESKLARLGPHKARVGSIVITNLEAVDLEVREAIVARSFKTLTTGTYGLRARDGREG